ncbi:inheritance of peroxisomes protein 1-domain-containing protein [Xylaria arbuscula]|nr:inheritance of peroxisomes protein 1-domain-containing protein [Xylaria arbuscula]
MGASRTASDRPAHPPQPRRAATAPVLAPAASLPRPPSPTGSTTSSVSHTASAISNIPRPSPDELVETLYSHPSVRIISFTTSQRDFAPPRTPSKNTPSPLPPSSHLERTIAAGALKIYRAPGSVAFLSCGSALQPILPKSQCWCIDEDNSRFVLQIRRPQYWRIEVPVEDPDDALRAEMLRDILDRILLFEKTECPFERSFTVALDPETPIKKKAWSAEGKHLISSAFSDLASADSPIAISRDKWVNGVKPGLWPAGDGTPDGRDRSFEEEPDSEAHGNERNVGRLGPHMFGTEEDEDAAGASPRRAVTRPKKPSSTGNVLETGTRHDKSPRGSPGAYEGTTANQRKADSRQGYSLSDQNDDGEDSLASLEGSGRVAPVNLARKRVTRMLAGRSFTAHSPPTSNSSAPSESNEQVATKSTPPRRPPTAARGHAPRASPTSASTRAPDVSSDPEGFESPEPVSQTAGSLADTATLNNATDLDPGQGDSADPSPRSTRFAVDSETRSKGSGPPTLDGQILAHRRTHANSLSISRPVLSPFPPAASLFSTVSRQTPESRLAAMRRLSAALMHKTIEILLSPPTYLIKLMLQVAAKIIAGEWRGLLVGFDDAGREIPVQWDYSDDEFSDLSDIEECTAADGLSKYGGSATRKVVRRRTRSGREDDNNSSDVD